MLVANLDDLVKSLKNRILVIPVKTGIQHFQRVALTMDSRFRGNDNFLDSVGWIKRSGSTNRSTGI